MSPTYANIFSYIFKSTYNNSYSPLYGASYNTLNTKYDINLRHMEIGDANGNISTSILEGALGGLDLDNSNYDTKIT
jgi:hypothetical protein